MSKRNPTPLEWLERLEESTAALTDVTLDTVAVPDFAGRVRAIERVLAEVRRRWNDEAVADAKDPEGTPDLAISHDPKAEIGRFGGVTRTRVVGDQFRTETYNAPTKRTYNTAPILQGITEALDDIETPIDALKMCISEGVVTVKWNWQPKTGTGLKRLAEQIGLPMIIVPRDIADDGDLDGPWVGAKPGEEKTRQVPIQVIDDDGKEIST